MKYEGCSVLTAFEAAAIVYMALDGIQIMGSGIWTDILLFFSWFLNPSKFRVRGYGLMFPYGSKLLDISNGCTKSSNPYLENILCVLQVRIRAKKVSVGG